MREEPRSRRDGARLAKEIAALEARIEKFQDLIRRVDEALAEASANGGADPKTVDLAARRSELERALGAAEEAWFELSAEAEE